MDGAFLMTLDLLLPLWAALNGYVVRRWAADQPPAEARLAVAPRLPRLAAGHRALVTSTGRADGGHAAPGPARLTATASA